MKDRLPDSVIAAARLLRTRLAIRGIPERQEKRRRDETLDAVAAQAKARGTVPAGATPRVLVFSLRGWYPHAAWETMLAHAMRLRGADVHVFNCGGPMPACEVNFRGVRPALACPECRTYPGAVVEAAQLTRSWLEDYVTAAERRAVADAVGALTPAQYASFEWNGIAVGDLVRWSVLWFLRKATIDLASDDAEAYRRYLISGALIATAASKLLAATRPDVVLELNGQFFAERILNTFIPAHVPVVAYEAGWRKNTLGFDRVSAEGPVDLNDAWSRLRDVPLAVEEEAQLDEWVRTREAGDMQRDFYINFQAAADPLSALGLDPTRPTAALFTNLVWDTAVMGRDRAFPSIRDWLRETIEMFRAHPERQLVIRIHPAEDLRPSQESVEKLGDFVGGIDMPPTVRLVPSKQTLSSYALLAHCQAALVYTSTIGVEAALRGIPVVVGAKVYYRDRGFTLDVHDRADFRRLLDEAMSRRLDSDEVQRARRFAYLLMFRYLKPIPVVHQRAGKFPILEPTAVETLAPSKNREFDTLIAQLMAGGPFV
jgi:hypothetical protein